MVCGIHRPADSREAGIDGVERALARSDAIRHDDSRAEAAIVQLEVRDHHALGVGGREIDRPALK
jgi:hypothetical protein